MKKLTALLIALTLIISPPVSLSADTADNAKYEKAEKLISQISAETDPTDGSVWNKESPAQFKWSYINGCMISALLRLYDVTGNTAYKEQAEQYMSKFVSDTESKTSGYIAASFKISSYALDDLNSGKAMIELTALDSPSTEKYNKVLTKTLYTDILSEMLATRSTAEGNLWHKNAYPYQVWLDGIYMETPFYLEYEYDIAKDKESFLNAANHVTNQIENVYAKLRDPSTGLYYHGYDAQADKKSGNYSRKNAMSWAEKDTGHSSSFWLRGTGWYAMALVDDIELMQKAEKRFGIDLTKQRSSLISIYTDLINSLLSYRDDSGMWYQVIDRPNGDYNYLETSGSCAISYSLMKGYNIGIADKTYYDKGFETFTAVYDTKLSLSESNEAVLKDICLTAGLAGPSSGTTSSSAVIGPKYNKRDGSYNYYVSEKTAENDAKGIAPFLLAYSQILLYDLRSPEPITETTTETTSESTTEMTTETTSESTTEMTTDIQKGDANCDGNITPADSIQILTKVLEPNHTMPIERKKEKWMEYVDMDKSKVLSASDAAIVLQIYQKNKQ